MNVRGQVLIIYNLLPPPICFNVPRSERCLGALQGDRQSGVVVVGQWATGVDAAGRHPPDRSHDVLHVSHRVASIPLLLHACITTPSKSIVFSVVSTVTSLSNPNPNTGVTVPSFFPSFNRICYTHTINEPVDSRGDNTYNSLRVFTTLRRWVYGLLKGMP